MLLMVGVYSVATSKNLQLWLQGHPHYNVGSEWGPSVTEWVCCCVCVCVCVCVWDYGLGGGG